MRSSTPKPSKQRGDVYWYSFSSTVKRRPGIIVARENLGDYTILCYVSESEPALAYQSVVAVSALGSLRDHIHGFVRGDMLFTVLKKDLKAEDYVAHASLEDMVAVGRAISFALELNLVTPRT